MNALEYLEEEACKDGIDVIYCSFRNDNIKGLYCDGTIGINSNIGTSAEKSCVMAEEMGHHYTSYGNIINLSSHQNCKQEQRARLWAYNKKVGLCGLISAYEHGCTNQHEIAEFLDITEQFLKEAIKKYRSKYGVFVTVDNYIIYFIPQLAIGKKFE